jgi:hypothetical protein
MSSETKIVSIVQDAILLRQPDAKPALESHTLTKIELDERCFVFPDGKVASHLLIIREGADRLCFDAVFTFNGTRLPGRLLDLSLEELKLFARELLDSVYAAKSGFVLRDTLKISIVVVANGYRIEFQRAQSRSEIYLSTGAIWRVLRGLLVAADEASPVISH